MYLLSYTEHTLNTRDMNICIFFKKVIQGRIKKKKELDTHDPLS